MVVSDSTVKVAVVAPKVTAVAPVNPLPVITAAVPPAIGPELGVTELTTGAAT